MFRDLWGSYIEKKPLIKINSLKQRNNEVQNTEPHESLIVLNRLPSDTGVMGIQSFLFGL